MEVTRDNLDEALNLLEAALGAGHMVAIDLEMTVGPPAAAACACAQSTRAQGIRTPDPKMAHSRGDTPEQRYRKMVHVVHRPLPATGGRIPPTARTGAKVFDRAAGRVGVPMARPAAGHGQGPRGRQGGVGGLHLQLLRGALWQEECGLGSRHV